MKKYFLGMAALLVVVLVVGLVIGRRTVNIPVIQAALGSAQTVATYATAPSVSNQGGLYLWDTNSNGGFENAGYAHFEGPTFLLSTTTISGYQTNGLNIFSTAINTASTTLCSILNPVGATVVISKATLDANPGNAGTANFNLSFGVTSTPQGSVYLAGSAMYGVTAFATSTNAQVVVNTNTPNSVIWPAGSYFVMHASATSTQTGNCKINYAAF